MAVNARRSIAINFTGDIVADDIFSAAQNAASPGSVTLHSLSIGANTITIPVSAGVSVKGATIIPPSGNTFAITLKGIAGDTGVVISTTDPTSIALDSGAAATFVLNAAGVIAGLRIVWT